ncbi:hypothetical protein NQ317_013738 [Molorchus minor]|uniref:CUB domain-containing protein n=1 Tax=Molorchus minor TaxID=1323400 RepID=A0ABQ9JD02_9CUCU|nr:hypothetical protein NQ317_013738 [Molorchus minor]
MNQTLALTITYKSNITNRRSASDCTYSSWYVSSSAENNKYSLAALCKVSEENYVIRSPFPSNHLEAATGSRLQLNLTVSYNVHNCGGIKSGHTGYISSPNYPNKPSTTVECAWLIKVGEEQTVNLTVLNMNLGSDCEKSYLTIYNGELPSFPKIGKFCKDDKPDRIISQSNALWVEFKHRADSTGTGFKLYVEPIEHGCGGIYHDKSRIIQTPNYGQDYPNNTECLWELRADAGYSIRLQFVDRFYIEDSENCKNDYVEIWDWKLDTWISLGKKCGRNTPDIIQSTGDKLKLLFRTNSDITANGFKAHWEWNCGGTFEASKKERYIVSPGYPIAYKPNLKCVYNIVTTASVLNIRFDDMDIEKGSTDCIYDNVTITGIYLRSNRVYCGTDKPDFIRIRGNVTITFKTDAVINRKGFKFMFKDESCGGNVTSEQIIEFPPIHYDSSNPYRYYHPRIRCDWRITAPSKKGCRIKVLNNHKRNIISLNMMRTQMCFAQGVIVYKGLEQLSSNRIATFCGVIKDGPPITADTDKMLVQLDSSPYSYQGFQAQVSFSYGSAAGCGGIINLNATKTIESPNLEDLDCHWTIIAKRDYQIRIQFTKISLPVSCTKEGNYTFCSCSFIELRDGAGSSSDLIGRVCSSDNSMSPDRKEAFKATLTPVLSPCGVSVLNVTSEKKSITTPNYPNKYPPNIKCSWAFETTSPQDKVVLHFEDFELIEQSQNLNSCDGDRVEIVEDPNRRFISEGLGPNSVYQGSKKNLLLSYNDALARHVFCGIDEQPFDYYSSGKSLTLLFFSINSENKGKGFKLQYSIAGCNRNYTEVQGRISNGNNKSECIITITVPENRTISLFFTQLYIQFSLNCTTASFLVRDGGPDGQELLRTCGYKVPNPVFSYTNKVHIHISGGNNMFKRYDFGYTSTDKGRGCGGELYNYKGRLSSPLYPNEYRNNTVCTWKVRVPIGLNVALKFINFDIQGSCDTNVKVTTYSGDQATRHMFCKGDNPGILQSDSSIQVEYSSSIHNGGSGWMAIYQGVTGDVTDIS